MRARQCRRGAPQGVIAPGRDEPVGVAAGDEGLVTKAVDHLLAGATLDVVGKPGQTSIGLLGGVFENPVMGVQVMSISLIVVDDEHMNALFVIEAKRFGKGRFKCRCVRQHPADSLAVVRC